MPPTTEQLRQWSAQKVMGWTINIPIAFTPWYPDMAYTGQIWMVVERMRELGWLLKFNTYYDSHHAKFMRAKSMEPMRYSKNQLSGNPCLAILRAAWAALEEI